MARCSCMLIVLSLTAVGLFAPTGRTAAAAETVYVWLDEDGVRHFGDRPPALGEGEERRIRSPNVVEAYRPPKASRLPTEAAPAPPPGPVLRDIEPARDEAALRAAQCRDARERLRVLHDRRRRGYALSEAPELGRKERSLYRELRVHCR